MIDIVKFNEVKEHNQGSRLLAYLVLMIVNSNIIKYYVSIILHKTYNYIKH